MDYNLRKKQLPNLQSFSMINLNVLTPSQSKASKQLKTMKLNFWKKIKK